MTLYPQAEQTPFVCHPLEIMYIRLRGYTRLLCSFVSSVLTTRLKVPWGQGTGLIYSPLNPQCPVRSLGGTSLTNVCWKKKIIVSERKINKLHSFLFIISNMKKKKHIFHCIFLRSDNSWWPRWLKHVYFHITQSL